MAVTALPDLNVLPAEELRALILAQHQELITKDEQLLSREREIEHLKLLLVKLHRMQFGRKSEKIQRQIEQLELRLEELESNRSEIETQPSEPASVSASATPAAAKPTRRTANAPARAERNGLSAMPGRVTQVGRGCVGDAGVPAREFRGHPACATEAELHEV